MKVLNLNSLNSKLNNKLSKAKREQKVSVRVSYSTNYAIYVHEDLSAQHPIGQAKFLEQPARDRRGEIKSIIQKAYKRTNNLQQSVLLGALFLQRESQKLVPIDTGVLKNSAETVLEK